MNFKNKAARQDQQLKEDISTTLLADTDTPGLVKKMVEIADVADVPTAAEFNSLLAALRTAGMM